MQSKRKRAEKFVNHVTKILLQVADEWKSVSDVFFLTYQGHHRFYPGMVEDQARWRARAAIVEQQRRLKYLKRKRWIQTKRTEHGLMVKLTDEGKIEKLRRSMIEKSKLSDNQICVVTFDFPQSARRGRDAFRYFLKSSRFHIIQQSVWATDRDVSSELMYFVRQTNIHRWVRIFVGKEILK